jgi:hypothetical protein
MFGKTGCWLGLTGMEVFVCVLHNKSNTLQGGVSTFMKKFSAAYKEMTFSKVPTMKRPTQAQFAAYQQIFDHFNQSLFAGCLPDCMLSYSRRRSNSHTLFTSGQWQEEAGSTKAEISLNLRQLHEDEPIDAMASLVRQMVHLWQEKYGHPSRKGYYNVQWAEKMEEIGLIPSENGEPGGKQTGQTIKHYIEENGLFEQTFLKMPQEYLWPFRPTVQGGDVYNGERNKTMYCCAGCGAKVWGKPDLGLICECGEVFADENGETKVGLKEKILKIWTVKFGDKSRNK